MKKIINGHNKKPGAVLVDLEDIAFLEALTEREQTVLPENIREAFAQQIPSPDPKRVLLVGKDIANYFETLPFILDENMLEKAMDYQFLNSWQLSLAKEIQELKIKNILRSPFDLKLGQSIALELIKKNYMYRQITCYHTTKTAQNSECSNLQYSYNL